MKIRDRIKELRRVKASELIPNPRNWRMHPKEQQDAMRGVLSEIGFAGAMIARETPEGLMLIDGHLRAEVSPDSDVPVLILDVDADEADKLLATFDPISAMADANQEKLGELLHGLEFDSEATMAMLEELAAEEGIIEDTSAVVEDEAPVDRAMELQEQWGTAEGQLWIIEGRNAHRLFIGDSTKQESYKKLFVGCVAQMIFTDPPYGVDYTGGAKKRERLANDHIGTEIYENSLPWMYAYTDEKAPLYLWYADGHAAAAAAAAAGFQIKAQIIWAKNHAQFVTSAHYKGKHEPCFYASKKGKSSRWHGQNNEVTLWEHNRASVNEFHPTQKPVEVAARAIKNSTQRDDIVLDGFMGGGTTMAAADQLNRKCYGIEISPKYCAVILERMTALGCKPRLAED